MRFVAVSEESIISQVRTRLIAVGVGVVVVLGVFLTLDYAPSVSLRIQRHVQQNWFVGVLVALIICSLAGKLFWEYRRFLRCWALIVVFLALHFAVIVPAIGKFGVIRWGHIEELYLFVIAMAEGATIFTGLRFATASLPHGTT